MSQAFYRKWRPQTWGEVMGQQHVIQTLRNAVAHKKIGHAYIFSGPRGTGKTTAARLLAKAVNCLAEDASLRPCNVCEHCRAVAENRFMDLIEIDAASNNGVDDIRDLRDKINFSPSQGKYKIYIIDEVHMLTSQAFNALLKTLEEPPPHAIFVLATTEMHKIPATVISRCQPHEFRRLPVEEIVAQLTQIVENEQLDCEPEALGMIARQAAGGMRDAISLLDQLASTGENITISLVETVLGTATSQTVLDLIDTIRDKHPAAGIEIIHRALDSGTDPLALARQIVEYLRNLLLIQMGNEAQVETAPSIKSAMKAHAGAFTAGQVIKILKVFNTAASEIRTGWQPSLNLELALAEVVDFQAEPQTVLMQTATAPSAPKKQPEVKEQKEPAPEKKAALEKIRRGWREIANWVRPHSGALNGLLNVSTVLELKQKELVLGFGGEVLCNKMQEDAEHIPLTIKAIKTVLDIEISSVRCVKTNASEEIPADIDQDGMVAAALQNGGKIIEIQE